jgi:hypothetical protein
MSTGGCGVVLGLPLAALGMVVFPIGGELIMSSSMVVRLAASIRALGRVFHRLTVRCPQTWGRGQGSSSAMERLHCDAIHPCLKQMKTFSFDGVAPSSSALLPLP